MTEDITKIYSLINHIIILFFVLKKKVIIFTKYSGNKLFDGGLSSFLDKFINLIHPIL